MNIPDSIALLAAGISMVNLVLFLWDHFRTRRHEALATNLAALASVDLAIKDIPSVLRFHGVADEDLAEAGVTAEELAYLLANFHTGRIYYSLVGKDTVKKPFSEDDTYRYHMCMSESTQRAWPILQRFLMDSPYKTRIELTISRKKS